MKNNIDFESALLELENIVNKLEAGNVGLNESIKLYEEGIVLSELCTKMLNDAKQKIEVIKNSNYKENEFDNSLEENNDL